ELRQGALAGVMTDAVARAANVPATLVRKALMLGGRLDEVARVALVEGRPSLEAVQLEVGRGLQPMLASTAASVAEAVDDLGLAAVEWKLDGIRVQAHRDGDEVRVFTRNLNDITERVPAVVDAVRSFDANRLVLDGEALVIDHRSGHPLPFQDSASEIRADGTRGGEVRPYFFDLVHLDGRDLIDEPLSIRRPLLEVVAGQATTPGTVTTDPSVAEAVLADALAAGHEGAVVKGIASTYEAGRRGKAWRKVKPVHTLDLVVLAAEWGHGRRRGWLSNLHLGARAVEGTGAEAWDGFVMVGKTFKGLTDELLRWQTERFLGLAEREELWAGPQTGIVRIRPEQVVEIAVDGVQRSTRYPGGVALRFARVVRYRDDKDPGDADAITTVQAMLR
ncbi:MAG: ATP-dependent DNA ligase, partial [Acidimicrobiales bacterium]|nr:ATP-dependent DNA ligase [Acidimicrobiales bacterium]